MRVGIVTQPLEMNYGGILQNWALQQALKSLGHEPITIDAYQRFSTPHYIFNWLRGHLMRAMGKRASLPLRYHGAIRSEKTGKFIETHINKTHVMWDYKPSVVKKYNIESLLVGSDQVWRIWYIKTHLEDMYLKFAEGLPLKRRVVYAASLGVDEWEYNAEQTAACAPLAQKFDAISVREKSGVELCRKYLGVDAQCVLDPTMLLDADGYQEIIDHEWNIAEPYLAVYTLDITPVKKAFINALAEARGLQVHYFSPGWKSQLTVEQWLAMLSQASMIVTDSFHGTVFSVLFGKEFYTMCNPHRGNSRITWLLQQVGLENRLISDTDPVEPKVHEIDWNDVNSRLEQRRRESMDFLASSLE